VNVVFVTCETHVMHDSNKHCVDAVCRPSAVPHLLARRARIVEAARRMKAACTAAPGCVAHVSMCTSSGTNPARTISRLH
jgi:hypothetical protein